MSAQVRVLVVEHEADAPAAWFGRWLEEAGATLDVRRPYLARTSSRTEVDTEHELPGDVAAHDALVVLGGEMGATSDELAWIPTTRELVRDAAHRAVPTLGICLGLQLCAVALGGAAQRNPRGQQLGVLPVGWNAEADADPLLGPVTGAGLAVHWNNDVVATLPRGATVLARAPGAEVQAARLGPTVWGVQPHPEVDAGIVTQWALLGDARESHGAAVVDDALADIDRRREELHGAWRPLAASLVRLATERRDAAGR